MPGLHSSREGAGSDIDWPPGNLKPETLDTLLENYGAYAISTRYFNRGEPLLNKQTPKYVAASRKFLTRTSISSNVSLPFDAEALVASGLDYLIMSIDGATQETYQQYRKRGDLGLVLENVRKLVAAKKNCIRTLPILFGNICFLTIHCLKWIWHCKWLKTLGLTR